jgi:hypothetical protein
VRGTLTAVLLCCGAHSTHGTTVREHPFAFSIEHILRFVPVRWSFSFWIPGKRKQKSLLGFYSDLLYMSSENIY